MRPKSKNLQGKEVVLRNKTCVCFITAGPITKLFTRQDESVCVFYYCRTYYKAVRVGGGGPESGGHVL